MKKPKNTKDTKYTDLPFVSIIIITRNVEIKLPYVLKSIEIQNYPKNKYEILIVDGHSTDKTLDIVKRSRLAIKVIQSKYPDDPEACRGVGLQYAEGTIIAYIDSDNYLPHAGWLHKMVSPFIFNPEITGAYPLRFAYRKKDTLLNRYFALLGCADPVGYYLEKADKLSFLTDKWNLHGRIISSQKSYFVVELDSNYFPTIGSNGFFIRKDLLLKAKSDPEHFFHLDVTLDLALLGFNKYAVVKDEIIHDTATTMLNFLKKRAHYMKQYQRRSQVRRYKLFDPNNRRDILNMTKFIFFSLTFVVPTMLTIRGFIKKRDIAWFMHPIFCFAITIAYIAALMSLLIEPKLKKI